jgi:putative Mn2+ efflux pump MntP
LRLSVAVESKIESSKEQSMAGVLSLMSLMSMVLGAAIAYLADRFPAHVEALETSAGALLIGGLALLGCALPTIL